MKKLATGIFALMVALTSMAQTTDNNTMKHDQRTGKHMKQDFSQLNLSADQQTQMKSISESYRQQFKDLKADKSSDQKVKLQALKQERRQKMMAVLTPDQQKKAADVRSQQKGDKKFGKHNGHMADLTQNLNLSTDQSAKVAQLNTTFKSNIASIKSNTSLSEADKKEQMKTAAKKHKADIKSLLTAEQKAQLKANRKKHSDHTAVK